MRVLLVEDNVQLSEWLARTLEREGYVVECVGDGEGANFRLRTEIYDLVILDLGLPKVRGDDVLSRLRARNNHVPVLILTARDDLQSRVHGLDIGADDYMVKPFDVAELEARIRVLLRRSANQMNPLVQCGNLLFNTNTRQFFVGEQPLSLTPREHALLHTLMMKVGKTVSKQAICEALFTVSETVSADAIEIYIHRLRKKLQTSQACIVTLRGLGYLLTHDGV